MTDKFYVIDYHEYEADGTLGDWSAPMSESEALSTPVEHDYGCIIRIRDNRPQPVYYWKNNQWEPVNE